MIRQSQWSRDKTRLSSRDQARYFWRYLTLMWEVGRREMLLAAFMILVTGLAPVFMTVFLRGLIDSAVGVLTGDSELSTATVWLTAFLAANLVQALSGIFVHRWLIPDMMERFQAGVNERLMMKASRLPLEAFEQADYYDLLHHAQFGVDRLWVPIQWMLRIPSDAITSIGLLMYLGSVNIWFPIILLIGITPSHIIGERIFERIRVLKSKHSPTLRYIDYLGKLMADKPAAAEVRLFGLGDFLLGRRKKLVAELREDRLALAKERVRGAIAKTFFEHFTYALVITWSVVLIVTGRLTLGLFAAFLTAAQQFMGSASMALGGYRSVTGSITYMKDVLDYLEAEEEWAPSPAVAVAPHGNGKNGTHDKLPSAVDVPSVRFEQVTFSYPGAQRPVLDRIDLVLEPGKSIALVGENGAGKSTLAKLLLGLYKPTSGRITVDGEDLAAIEPRVWRKRVAPVFQDYVKYAVTARENIGFGELRRIEDTAAIATAASKSGADEVIAALPAQYETMLGKTYDDKGQDLSSGQWQKVAIARAYLREASVLVLDEPTAALDAKTEVDVYRHFRDISQGRSVLLISHRLGSARLADRIVFLDGGKITEDGTHAELMDRGGRYAEMYSIQAGWYR